MGSGDERYAPSGAWAWGVMGAGSVAMALALAAASTMGGTAEGWALAGLGILGGSYVIAKGRSLRAHVVELDEDALRYGDRRIPYRSIRGLRRGWVDAGGARRSLLARSWIYALETEDGTIQILGKFYPNDEAMMQRIAERSGVTIQDD